MTDTNQLREAFEVRMTDGGKWPAAVERGRGGAYRLAQTENAWTEWEACAEAMQALAQATQAESGACKSFTELRERHREGVDAEIAAMAAEAETDERAAFEAEMRREDVWGHRSLKKRPDGRYQNWQVDLMWDVWQARSILALRPAAVPMTGWQPIETAPNPGPFLAVLDCGGDQTICTMRHGVIASKNSRPDGDFIRERVTHWMPLPPFPKSTQTGITAQAKKEDK